MLYDTIKQALNTVITKDKNASIFVTKIYKKDISDEEKIELTYQIIGTILNQKDEPNFKLKNVLITLKSDNNLWKHSIYDKTRDINEERDDFVMHPFEVVAGVSKCDKCGSNKTFTFQKQVRSSDEPMTTFIECVNIDCGNIWTYSG